MGGYIVGWLDGWPSRFCLRVPSLLDRPGALCSVGALVDVWPTSGSGSRCVETFLVTSYRR